MRLSLFLVISNKILAKQLSLKLCYNLPFLMHFILYSVYVLQQDLYHFMYFFDALNGCSYAKMYCYIHSV